MKTPDVLRRVAATALFAVFAGSLCAQFADQSIPLGISGQLPQSVLDNPQIVLFYWSPNWNVASTYTQAQINQATSLMVQGDGLSPSYFKKLGQYTDTAGSKILPVLIPSAGDTAQLNAITSCGLSDPGTSINSVTLTAWIQCMLDGTGSLGFAFPPTVGTPDTLPMFLLPSTAVLNNDNLSVSVATLTAIDLLAGSALATKFPAGINLPNGCSDFYGYHFWTSPLASLANPFNNPKLRIPYAVIPLSCFTGNSPLASDPSQFYTGFDDLTEGISHELMEALVDPFVPLGWIDNSQGSPLTQGESGDLCYQNGRRADVWYQNQVVSAYWSNADNICVAGNNTLSTVTLSATMRNDGPASVLPTSSTFQFDVRSGKLLKGANPLGNDYKFAIQVVNGTTHSYKFPSPLLQNPSFQVIADGTQPLQGSAAINADTAYSVTYKTQYFVNVLTPDQANPNIQSGYFDIGNLQISVAPTYTEQATGKLFQFFNWTGTSTALTNSFNATVDKALFYEAKYVRDVSPAISFVRSGLTLNRATQIYSGTITITNNGQEVYSNFLPVVLTGLPAGVTLVNSAGTYKGSPYLNTTTSSGLPPGGTNTIPVQFKITGGSVNYGVSLYSFH